MALPAALPELEHTRWRELFKYPRSVALVCLTGLSQTSGVGLAMWAPTLLLLLLKTTPAEASFLMIWVGVSAFVGRVLCSFLPDLIGRRASGFLACLGGVVTLIVGGSNFVKPEASVEAMVPAMFFLAFWAALAAVAFWLIGIETKGRSIEEIDAALTKPALVKALAE